MRLKSSKIPAIIFRSAPIQPCHHQVAPEVAVLVLLQERNIIGFLAAFPKFQGEVPGLGVVEVKGGFDRKNWESGKVLHRVIMEAIVDKETGEIHSFDSPTAFATAVENNIRACLGMTGSTAWKVGERKPDGTYKGGLRSLDIDPTDYCDEIERPRLAIIPKRKVTS